MAVKEEKQNLFASIQIVCFKIGVEEYGIDILQVQEILKLPSVTKLPKSNPYIMGVMDLRGKVIPIVDLSIRFGIRSGKDQKKTRAIVVDIGGKQVGLAIDSVSHVIKVNSGEIEPPPPVVKGISGKYIVGIAKLEGGFVVILDIHKIFSSDEVAGM
ncbi:MAG: chemotaxis protein CheW [Spirochaetes bacterium]|jgi:purine-binding chemotaxis protein CheW|nr:chemotaxis protein CheW [Spirochaetota bacterium]